MCNALRVKIADSHGNLSCIELNNILGESLLALEDFVQLTTSDERHDEVKSELRLEQIVHAH